MFSFYRLNAIFSLKRDQYRAITLTVEKCEPFRDAFLYEKAKNTDIYAVRFELITVFSFKKRNF
jgi:hypothetical protein